MALFSEFQKASYNDWLEQLQKELKGADTGRYTHKNSGGVTVPTYVSADEPTSYFSVPAKELPETENTAPNEWIACVEVDTDDLGQCNRTVLKLLNQGAGAVRLKGIGISDHIELRQALNGVQPELIYTHFDCGEANPSLLFLFYEDLIDTKQNPLAVRGSLAFDPYGDFAAKGVLSSRPEETITLIQALLDFAHEKLPAFKTITHKGSLWYNAGADTASELAFSLACLAEYLCQTGKAGKVAGHIALQIASDADFFTGIAKLRSMRLLWERMLGGFGLAPEHYPLRISAETPLRNKTIFDPWNNLLRASTESMAAIIGGADELTIHPYNAVFSKPDELAYRTALNVHHILRYESHLDAVKDAAAGSGYIETLTDKLTESAWDIFIEIEKQGGYLASLKKGWIQERIEHSRKQKEQNFSKGKTGMIGINRFSKVDETGAQPLSFQNDPLQKTAEIKVVETYREAETIEQIRLFFNNSEKKQHVFLVMTGNPKRAADRAGFSADFMAMAGISTKQGNSKDKINIQLKDAQNALAIILCADDADYQEAVQTMKQTGWPDIPVYIAGKPEDSEALRTQGINGFIYLGCDALSFFHALMQESDIARTNVSS